MSRNATITIHNQTDVKFIYEKQNVIHGKIVSYDTQIAPNSIGEVKVAMHDGSCIGPEGRIWYIADDNNGSVDIFWHHPYGHGESSYWIDTDNWSRFQPHPNSGHPVHPTGHDQSVDLYIVPA